MLSARSFVLGAAALVAVAHLFITWTAPLIDQHAFRQTQTALTVYWYLRDGIDLLRPPLPLFGTTHPSIPLEFPLYQAIAAAILKLLGQDSVAAVTAACRGVSFAFHLLAAWPLHRLAQRHFSTAAADGAVLLWLALPYAVFWSTSAMIESMVVALSLLHMDLVDRASRSPRFASLIALAAVAGVLAAMVKVTTFVLYLPAAGLLYAIGRRIWVPSEWRLRDVSVLLFAAALPMMAAFAWTGWADLVKRENLVGGLGLVSPEMLEWSFGTWAQRLQFESWKAVAITVGITALGLPALLAVVVGGLGSLSDPRRLAWALPAALGPAVFINLYVVHDYYSYAILPVLVVLAAWGLVVLVRLLGRRTWIMALAMPALVVATWIDLDLRWRPLEAARRGDAPIYLVRRLMPNAPHWPEAARPLEIARHIKEGNYPPGPIVVTGNDWMADIAFYAERPAFMIGKDAGHKLGGCSQDNWKAIRAERPVLFIKVRPAPNECEESVPIHACTIADNRRFWMGRCMAGS
ncbi:dolichyl-phosphate-mannose-protein mannosyltransferase [Stella humosa]|uniref:Dolichyl-phosphate-mannose-protein mannosyltransferase n=1 Tax=Stella humosa TaxID=94 RepID=A0A3N1MFG2_9PROT|nr:glycosyltransferase family 39 protein [Stella humosa]ROP99945.1 dolichyl-phosphate-mannose-protein mannosyltransferase [Stella humosa]BBK30825.1 hypothetical protein STHU_14590 [Stella humosa]